MSRLTWQQVDAPDLGRAADILNAAANQVGSGGAMIAGAARNARQDQMNRRSAAALPILAGIQSSGDVAGALSQIGQVLRPEDMNEETRKAYLGLMGQGLDFDRSRAGTAAVRNADSRAQTTFDRTITREDQEAAIAGKILAAKEGAYTGGRALGGDPTLDLIREHEGFRETPYWDVNALRTGYGSDTVTLADGTVKPVVEGTVVSREDAERDLKRRVDTEFRPRVISAVGAETFANLSPNQQAALTSITYNYGSLPESVARAVQSGDMNAAAAAIDALGVHNDGINARRRRQEAELFAGGGGVRTGLADLVPENNLLLMDFWDPQSDDLRAQEQEGFAVGRGRQDLMEADLTAAIQRQGTSLINELSRQAVLPEDLPAMVAAANASDEIKAAALSQLDSPLVAANFATQFDPTGTAGSIPNGAVAVTALAQAEAMTNDFKNNNPTLRIQTNEADYSSDPAVVLTERLGGTTDDDRGEMLQAINDVVSAANEKGITISPSEAAAVLYESAQRKGFSGIIPGGEDWGNIYVDPDQAVQLAEAYLSPEQKRKGALMSAQVQEAEAAVKQLRQDMAKTSQALTQARQDGNEEAIEKWEERGAILAERAATIERSMPFLPQREAREGGGSNTPTSRPTPTTPPADPLATAALQVADTALQTATDGGVDLAGLANASTEMQVRVLETAIQTLKEQGAPAGQIAALQELLEQAITADAAEMNNR